MSPEEKDRKIERLEQENEALREKIAELERRLGLDSHNSSKPPSSDGLKKKATIIRTKSLTEKGKRPSGGQLGHPGQRLEAVLQPDNVVEHPTPCLCSSCGCDVSQIEVEKMITRQVFDLPCPRIIEQESWAKSMKKVLLLACNYKHRYPKGIPQNIVARLSQLYEQILKRGQDYHQFQPPLTRKGNRGRVKRRVGHNLLLRFQNYKRDVLRFLTEPDVPFTNNQAERDLRMMKCKQKISGGFRSFDFAVSFANIRSFLSTASKRGLNLLEVITDALQGNLSVFFSSNPTT